MAIGDFVKEKREELGMSKAALAKKAGISSSEMFRIESGKRKESSTKILFSIADALGVPQEEILKEAGYSVPNNVIERAFPRLKEEKQIDAIKKIEKVIANNPGIGYRELEGVVQQAEMYLLYCRINQKLKGEEN